MLPPPATPARPADLRLQAALCLGMALVLLLAFFLPVVHVQGLITSDLSLSPAQVLGNLFGGGGGQGSSAEGSGVGRSFSGWLQAECGDLSMPVTGPLLLALAGLALVLQYLLLPLLLWRILGRRQGGWLIAWLALGVVFGLLYLLGAAITQHDLNALRGPGLVGRVLAVIGSTAARLYEIRLGLGGQFILVAAAAGLALALWHRQRRPA